MSAETPTRSGAALAVVAGSGPEGRRAVELAARLALPMLPPERAGEVDYVLGFVAGRLEIRPTRRGGHGPVGVDLGEGRTGHRRRQGGRRRELIARAVGARGEPVTVVDATAGLGRDAFVLACLGCLVTAVERSRVVAALLEDGLLRGARDPALADVVPARLTLVIGDARLWLAALEPGQRPEVVYLDPMFPPRRRSARVKKEMQLFQALVGEDPDTDELFQVARAVARRRVVVKRPLHAPPLASRAAQVYRGRSVRWDVFLV